MLTRSKSKLYNSYPDELRMGGEYLVKLIEEYKRECKISDEPIVIAVVKLLGGVAMSIDTKQDFRWCGNVVPIDRSISHWGTLPHEDSYLKLCKERERVGAVVIGFVGMKTMVFYVRIKISVGVRDAEFEVRVYHGHTVTAAFFTDDTMDLYNITKMTLDVLNEMVSNIMKSGLM